MILGIFLWNLRRWLLGPIGRVLGQLRVLAAEAWAEAWVEAWAEAL